MNADNKYFVWNWSGHKDSRIKIVMKRLPQCPVCKSDMVRAEMFEDYMNGCGAVVQTRFGRAYIDWAAEMWMVYCYDPQGCDGHTATANYDSRHEAIHAWIYGPLGQRAPQYGYA